MPATDAQAGGQGKKKGAERGPGGATWHLLRYYVQSMVGGLWAPQKLSSLLNISEGFWEEVAREPWGGLPGPGLDGEGITGVG